MSKPSVPSSAKELTDRVRKVRKMLEAEKIKLSLPLAQKTASILFGVTNYDVLSASVAPAEQEAPPQEQDTPQTGVFTKAIRTFSLAINKVTYNVISNYELADLTDATVLDRAIMEHLIPFMNQKVAENDYVFYAEIIASSPFEMKDIDRCFLGHDTCLSEMIGMAAGILKDAIRDTIQRNLTEEPDEFNAIVDADFNAVMESMQNGDEDEAIVRYQKNPDLTFSTDENGWTLLTYAVSLDLTKMVKHLIGTGCPIDHQDKEGWTAINKGSQSGSFESIKLLLEAGANPSISTKIGWQPYGTAAVHGHQNIADLLEKFGAHPFAGNAAFEGTDLGKLFKGFLGNK